MAFLAGADAGGVLLVHIGADLEAVGFADDHRGVLRRGGGVFAGADVHLDDRAVARRAHGEALDEQGEAFQFALRGGEFGAGGGELGFGDGDVLLAVFQIIAADGARVGDGGEAGELGLSFAELGLADGDFRPGDFEFRLGGKFLRAEIAVIEPEEHIAGFHRVVDLHVHLGDESGLRHADGDVFAERFENAGGGNRLGVGLRRGRQRRIAGGRHLRARPGGGR